MAATDMRKAGLEPGCKVALASGRHGSVKEITQRGSLTIVTVTSLGTDANYFPEEIVRDYEDAQKARHARLDVLDEHYPSDAEPENTDTIERYIGINRFPDWTPVPEHKPLDPPRWWWYFADDFAEVCNLMSDVGEMPEAIYDLDTGERIDLHVSVTITRSEDQHVMINVLQCEPETQEA
jgi:hypothetical protein